MPFFRWIHNRQTQSTEFCEKMNGITHRSAVWPKRQSSGSTKRANEPHTKKKWQFPIDKERSETKDWIRNSVVDGGKIVRVFVLHVRNSRYHRQRRRSIVGARNPVKTLAIMRRRRRLLCPSSACTLKPDLPRARVHTKTESIFIHASSCANRRHEAAHEKKKWTNERTKKITQFDFTFHAVAPLVHDETCSIPICDREHRSCFTFHFRSFFLFVRGEKFHHNNFQPNEGVNRKFSDGN